MRDIDYCTLVRLIRTQRGQTQEDLARELEVTVGTLNGWENGRHRPIRAQRTRLEHLAEELGIRSPVSSTTSAANLAAPSNTRSTKGRSDV